MFNISLHTPLSTCLLSPTISTNLSWCLSPSAHPGILWIPKGSSDLSSWIMTSSKWPLALCSGLFPILHWVFSSKLRISIVWSWIVLGRTEPQKLTLIVALLRFPTIFLLTFHTSNRCSTGTHLLHLPTAFSLTRTVLFLNCRWFVVTISPIFQCSLPRLPDWHVFVAVQKLFFIFTIVPPVSAFPMTLFLFARRFSLPPNSFVHRSTDSSPRTNAIFPGSTDSAPLPKFTFPRSKGFSLGLCVDKFHWFLLRMMLLVILFRRGR